MAAVWTKVPEIALSPQEGKAIGEAVAKVSEHYDLTMDPKTGAWVNLIMVVGAAYGPRVFAYRARRESERKNRAAPKPQEAQAVVTPQASPTEDRAPDAGMLAHMGMASPGDRIN